MSQYRFTPGIFMDALSGSSMAPWTKPLIEAVQANSPALKHGNLPAWQSAVDALPPLADAKFAIVQGVVEIAGSFDADQRAILQDALTRLIPWRKGPFRFADIFIDTEWRSDWKWDRLADHIHPLAGRTVLDVGCGSGYHLWRMRDAGASLVLGIDPSLLFLMQFLAVQHYVRDAAVQFLPLPMEALPSRMHSFDTVFSMGVLYHRREPGRHLKELSEALTSGGELVLETLVCPGSTDTLMALSGRYANMRNIWELPTLRRLERWVAEAGFVNVRCVSLDTTSVHEQRRTAWMPTHSLAQALDSADSSQTVEGHPRPIRAIVLAST